MVKNRFLFVCLGLFSMGAGTDSVDKDQIIAKIGEFYGGSNELVVSQKVSAFYQETGSYYSMKSESIMDKDFIEVKVSSDNHLSFSIVRWRGEPSVVT
ncbi:MAG: hypothetical protein AAB505_01670, partial [Patescibacteria group bacterium]